MKSTWYKKHDYGINRKLRKKSDDETMVDFQTQSTQHLVNEYKLTSSRNDRWWMRLKLIQEEYYSIGNQKS